MNARNHGAGAAIVHLPMPDEQLPSGPLWTLVDDDSDGVVIASRPDHRRGVLLVRTAQDMTALTTLQVTPAVARTAAAAVPAAAGDAEGQETTR